MPKGFIHIEKYGLIYARVPKVANSSIKAKLSKLVKVTPNTTLKPTNDRFWRDCVEGASFMSPCTYTREYDRLFSFTFIRDPLDRLFSCYVNKIIANNGTQSFIDRGYTTTMSFDDFVAHTCTIQIADMDVHTKPQEFLITDVKGRLPKFVGLLEHLDQDWVRLRRLFARHNIPVRGSLPVKNARKEARVGVSNAMGDDTRRTFELVYGPSIALHTRLSEQRKSDAKKVAV